MQPKQYTQGWVEFYKLRFKVTPDVLIPRPETELLVDEVLNFVHSSQIIVHGQTKKQRTTSHELITILDLGTGSGNIAISITKNLHPTSEVGVKIIATDVSEKALEIAKQNAKLYGVTDNIEFIQSDLLSAVHLPGALLCAPDIIVTNLPYIPSARIPYLDSSIKDFEPHVALDGGEDGFELYRKLFAQINEKDWHPKLILGEIDYTHGELAVIEAQKYFPEAEVEVKTDLAHRQRVLLIRQLL